MVEERVILRWAYQDSERNTLDLETGMLTGVADPRKNGAAVGVHL